ncbi:MAG: tRNA-dihydrouridine synthase family protein [Pirellulaceae bacterium]
MKLPHLRIGSLDIGFPVVQAALSGYSDWPMRMLAREQGASYTLCEVMLDQFLVAFRDRSKNKHFLYNSIEEQPVAGQLMGAEPLQFSLGAKRLVEAGFAVIDINFGCPVKKVLGRCRGGFHLGQPAIALEIIRRTRDIVPPQIPVTVKMRRGIDDSEASREQFFEILSGGFEAGLAAATVHGRTVLQRYNGPSRWEFLKDVKQAFPNQTILGSGDLFTATDCLRMLSETGVDGVTVARGAIGNPWIFEQTRALAGGLPLPPPQACFANAKSCNAIGCWPSRSTAKPKRECSCGNSVLSTLPAILKRSTCALLLPASVVATSGGPHSIAGTPKTSPVSIPRLKATEFKVPVVRNAAIVARWSPPRFTVGDHRATLIHGGDHRATLNHGGGPPCCVSGQQFATIWTKKLTIAWRF